MTELKYKIIYCSIDPAVNLDNETFHIVLFSEVFKMGNGKCYSVVDSFFLEKCYFENSFFDCSPKEKLSLNIVNTFMDRVWKRIKSFLVNDACVFFIIERQAYHFRQVYPIFISLLGRIDCLRQEEKSLTIRLKVIDPHTTEKIFGAVPHKSKKKGKDREQRIILAKQIIKDNPAVFSGGIYPYHASNDEADCILNFCVYLMKCCKTIIKF